MVVADWLDHIELVLEMIVDNHFRDVTKMGVENIFGVIYEQ